MTVISDFVAADLDLLTVQPSQRHQVLAGAWYEAAGPAWTVRDDAGTVIACLGLAELGPSYRVCWALLASGKRHAMVTITRAVRRVIDAGGWRRVELQTDARDDEAARWASMLGFVLESTKRCAMPDGGDLLIWARIRGSEWADRS